MASERKSVGCQGKRRDRGLGLDESGFTVLFVFADKSKVFPAMSIVKRVSFCINGPNPPVY